MGHLKANSVDPDQMHLIRVYTVCLQDFLLETKFIKMKKYTRQPQIWKWTHPFGKDEKVHWGDMGKNSSVEKSTGQIWVKLLQFMRV